MNIILLTKDDREDNFCRSSAPLKKNSRYRDTLYAASWILICNETAFLHRKKMYRAVEWSSAVQKKIFRCSTKILCSVKNYQKPARRSTKVLLDLNSCTRLAALYFRGERHQTNQQIYKFSSLLSWRLLRDIFFNEFFKRFVKPPSTK